MARERGLKVDLVGYQKAMDEHVVVSGGPTKTVIEVSEVTTQTPTEFVGFDQVTAESEVMEVVRGRQGSTGVVLDQTPFYAEMGGQVGDTGVLSTPDDEWRVVDTRKVGDAWLHLVDSGESPPPVGQRVQLAVDVGRRAAIQRHHTVTHLLHWALHEVVGPDVAQKGSYVGPEKLTFDFSSAPLTPQQVADVERLVNEQVLDNAAVTWSEVDYDEVKKRSDIMQLFGEKYGERVRVVQIGGQGDDLNGYSMELCGGTHCRATGEVGLFRVASEAATAAGIRRIEAISGLEAYRFAVGQADLLHSISGRVNAPLVELERKIENLLSHQKELEKQVKSLKQQRATGIARSLVERARQVGGVALIAENLGEVDSDSLQAVLNQLKGDFNGVAVLAGVSAGSVDLVASVSSDLTSRVQAGKIIKHISPIVGGRGGGRPDYASGGGGREIARLDEALASVEALLLSPDP
jgi:alanyl-tRNA synthetase